MQKLFILTYNRTFLLLILIFVLSTASFGAVPSLAQFSYSDKLIHLLMYAGLAFGAVWDYNKDTVYKKRYKNLLLLIFVFFVVFGGIIELIQEYLLHSRSGEWLDWLADLIGLAVGYAAGHRFFRKTLRN